MGPTLQNLQTRIDAASGADRDLDADIETALHGAADEAPSYTASVDRCLDLLHAYLPDWHWHLGRGASGVMPYASLTKGRKTVTADGVTVPLVLLSAIFKALLQQHRHKSR